MPLDVNQKQTTKNPDIEKKKSLLYISRMKTFYFYLPISHFKKFHHILTFLLAPKLSITERLHDLLLQGVTIEDPMQ